MPQESERCGRAVITGRVAGVLKLTAKPGRPDKTMYSEKAGSPQDITATVQFEAPSLVRWCRCSMLLLGWTDRPTGRQMDGWADRLVDRQMVTGR
jgi:hypothetical protein